MITGYLNVFNTSINYCINESVPIFKGIDKFNELRNKHNITNIYDLNAVPEPVTGSAYGDDGSAIINIRSFNHPFLSNFIGINPECSLFLYPKSVGGTAIVDTNNASLVSTYRPYYRLVGGIKPHLFLQTKPMQNMTDTDVNINSDEKGNVFKIAYNEKVVILYGNYSRHTGNTAGYIELIWEITQFYIKCYMTNIGDFTNSYGGYGNWFKAIITDGNNIISDIKIAGDNTLLPTLSSASIAEFIFVNGPREVDAINVIGKTKIGSKINPSWTPTSLPSQPQGITLDDNNIYYKVELYKKEEIEV